MNDIYIITAYSMIEDLYSQMEAMGVQCLQARTHHRFNLKTWASLLALAFTNIIN